MKQYKSLDFAKFVCAVLIIILHTAPFSSYSKALTFGFRNIVTVIAVPFFFLTSGFLAFKKMDTLTEEARKIYIRGYLKRLAVMYLIWSVVYFGFVAVKWSRVEFSYLHVLEYVKDFFFEGSYSTIWFLPALFTAVLIINCLHKKLSYGRIFAISSMIYLFTLGGSSYYGLVCKIQGIKALYDAYYSFFDTIKNGVCFGMIFVSMGAWVSENEEKLTRTNNVRQALFPVLVCGVFLAVEEFLVAYTGWNSRGVDTVISLIPFTFFFMRFVLMLDLNIENSVCATLRKYSILMFLCQRIPLSVISLFMADTLVATNSAVHFVVVLATTLLISWALLRLAEKFRMFKYMF